MKTKTILINGLAALIVRGATFLINPIHLIQENPEPSKLDCSNPPDIFFLKQSEKSYTQDILKNPNAIVVIPELNRVLANTELLECPDIDFSKYIGGI